MVDVPYDIDLIHVFDVPPNEVYKAFTDSGLFARWYGPEGFPVDRDSLELDARVGGSLRFTMVGETDPSIRTSFDGRFTEVVANELLAASGTWFGIPGQVDGWSSHLRVEFHDQDGSTRLVLREGPHPEGTADMGRQAWEMMVAKLEVLLSG